MSLLLLFRAGGSGGANAYTLAANGGVYALAGQAAVVLRPKRLVAVVGSYALSGNTANILKGRKLSAVAGAYAYTGIAANITYTPIVGAYVLTANTGAYLVSGVSVGLRRGRLVTGAAGAYALSGTGATVLKSKKVAANAGLYAVAGVAAGVRKSKRIASDSGAYALNGNAATVSYTPTAGAYVLSCAAGVYAVAGNDAAISRTVYTPINTGAGRGSREHHGMAIDVQIEQRKALEVIAKVAVKQVEKPRSESHRKQQLAHEIAKADLGFNAFYVDLLVNARSQVLTEQIRAEFDSQRLDPLYLQSLIAATLIKKVEDDDAEAITALMLLL